MVVVAVAVVVGVVVGVAAQEEAARACDGGLNRGGVSLQPPHIAPTSRRARARGGPEMQRWRTVPEGEESDDSDLRVVRKARRGRRRGRSWVRRREERGRGEEEGKDDEEDEAEPVLGGLGFRSSGPHSTAAHLAPVVGTQSSCVGVDPHFQDPLSVHDFAASRC